LESEGQKSSTKLAAILLAVGLIIGGGGGYFAGSAAMQPRIGEYEDQVASLNLDVGSLSSQVNELNSTVSGLQAENENYMTQISNLESDLTDARETIAEYEDRISDLESQITAQPGFEKFSAYGFSFEYPTGMTISVQGLLESTANGNSGMVIGEYQDPYEAVGVAWMKTVIEPDLSMTLDGAFAGMAQQEAVTSLETGELVETTVMGHHMIYQYFTMTVTGGETYYGIYGVWYCDDAQRLYTLSLTLDEAEPLPIYYQEYLDYFTCHVEVL